MASARIWLPDQFVVLKSRRKAAFFLVVLVVEAMRLDCRLRVA